MSDSQDRRARSRARALLALAATVAVVALAAAVAATWQLTSIPTPTSAPASAPARTAPVAATTQSGFVRVTVARVVDGDTIHVTMPDGADETIRFIGVNTPESTTRHEPYGEEASAYSKKRLPKGLTVWLETDVGLRDRYGRMLAYVWLAEPASDSPAEVRSKMFNAELLIEGYAQLMTIPPDVRYVEVFTPLQAEAREADRGLWGLPVK
jgi:micrococcal nuclease